MELHFTNNWNNKLDADYYTTFRIHNNIKYQVGNILDIHLHKKYLHTAYIVDIRTITLDKLNPFITGLDAAMPVDEFIKLLRRFYGTRNGKEQNIYKLQWDFILLNRIKE